MRMEITSEESELVFNYVMKRPLFRPNITLKTMILSTLVFSIIALIISMLAYVILLTFEVYISKLFCYILVCLILFLISSKKICINAIKLYQHYAPEKIRRKCMLKPTCSEYAIIVLQKYGVVIGSFRILKRLFHTCKSSVYFIDEP